MATTLLTMNLDQIGQMSCNPSIGGVGKGHMVRELDALGGAMGRLTDASGIHFRILNASRGVAVRGPRAQADRVRYRIGARRMLERTPNLRLCQGMAAGLRWRTGTRGLEGVELLDGSFIPCDSGGAHLGHLPERPHPHRRAQAGGGPGRRAALHPPGRAAARPGPARAPAQDRHQPAHRRRHHRLLPAGGPARRPGAAPLQLLQPGHRPAPGALPRGPHHPGNGAGGAREPATGRPCTAAMWKAWARATARPSRTSSSSSPTRPATRSSWSPIPWRPRRSTWPGCPPPCRPDVQLRMVRSLPGFEAAEILRPGYAIEYDSFDPLQLRRDLSMEGLEGVWFAGQINGTTGYEEAAGQGIMAGINAVRWLRDQEPLVLGRDQAYIGVMIDDLVTKGTDEPYRMLTARAEHRLSLACDLADAAPAGDRPGRGRPHPRGTGPGGGHPGPARAAARTVPGSLGHGHHPLRRHRPGGRPHPRRRHDPGRPVPAPADHRAPGRRRPGAPGRLGRSPGRLGRARKAGIRPGSATCCCSNCATRASRTARRACWKASGPGTTCASRWTSAWSTCPGSATK